MTALPSLAGGEGLSSTLSERGNRYGDFTDHALLAQELKETMRCGVNWRHKNLAPDMREALDIIQHKIARILNGDPDYSDSWHDIAGYATLVDKRLKAEGK